MVVGPTASGKSDLAQELACRLGGEVVSADSMQVYRGMDIGTGKVPVLERRVPHHGLDLVDPGEPYSAALFQDYARRCFEAIDARGGRSILAGGTGLYVRAAVDDYDFPQGDQTENPVRERWTAFAEENGAMALWEELRACDPKALPSCIPTTFGASCGPSSFWTRARRMPRSAATWRTLGQAVPACFFGLAVDPANLVRRIDARVDAMFEAVSSARSKACWTWDSAMASPPRRR